MNDGLLNLLEMAFRAYDPCNACASHALPGELPGTHAIERAWHEALAGERTATGVMVHLVPDESVDGLLDYAATPVDDVALVLVHSGGQKGSGVLTKLRKLDAVTEVKSEAEAAGVSWATVRRAKSSLGVASQRIGGPGAEGYWEWSLPDTKSAAPMGKRKRSVLRA